MKGDAEVKFNPADLIGKITSIGEILSKPTWHPDTRMWRAMVAVNPSGPFVLAEFKITIGGNDCECK